MDINIILDSKETKKAIRIYLEQEYGIILSNINKIVDAETLESFNRTIICSNVDAILKSYKNPDYIHF